MGDKNRGFYQKFDVLRTDGKSAPGEKHDGCDYFVLDLTHDPHALPAIRAYIYSASGDYPKLTRELRHRVGLWQQGQELQRKAASHDTEG